MAAQISDVEPCSVSDDDCPGSLANEEVSCNSDQKDEVSCKSDEKDQATLDRDKSWVIFLLAAVSSVEGADMSLFASVAFAMQMDLGLGLTEISLLNMWSGIAGCCAAPVWGVLADRRVLTRRAILTVGCLGWGITTILLAVFDTWSLMMALRALNGVFLACLRPISNGLVPDMVPETQRGKVFGQIQFAMDIGTMLAPFLVTPVSTRVVLGVYGWRVAFAAVGLVSVALALLVGLTMVEPPKEGAPAEGPADGDSRGGLAKVGAAASEEACRLVGLFRSPTFVIIVLQGLFGMCFWSALGSMTMFFQTAGLTDFNAGFITTLQRGTGAIGHLLGGLIGDRASVRWPIHGRAFIAQVSVAAGIPVVWLMFSALEPGPDMFIPYCFLVTFFGLTAMWCAAGVNWPIFCEIVPAESRSTVVAWDTALEGLSSSILGNMMVAFLAKLSGYEDPERGAPMRNQANAVALGHGLFWTTFAPLTICLVFYSLLHWSYPLDRARVQRQAAAAADAKSESERI